MFAEPRQWKHVYIDLPGMGMSGAGPEMGSAEAVAEAFVSFARQTFGNELFAVLGNSFGGMISRHGSRTVPPQTVLRKDPSLLASLDAEDRADYEVMAVVQSRKNWSLFRDSVLPPACQPANHLNDHQARRKPFTDASPEARRRPARGSAAG